MIGRSGKQCYDKFRSLPKSDIVLCHKGTKVSFDFYTMLFGSFSDFEENEIATEIIKKKKITKKLYLIRCCQNGNSEI